MPKRTDIKSILIIGPGPIIIGQACEFDYSGAQACKALKEEGYRIILVNSNPATIMTDPTMADSTYIEPINFVTVAKIIELEAPDALLPTMGGQTALNCALELEKQGVLEKFGVELIGANADAIDKAENRKRFEESMKRIGLETPLSKVAGSIEDALKIAESFKYPCVIRPSFTLGGTGGGIAHNREEFISICKNGLDLSPTTEVQVDESLLGWKEYEMEVVRDVNDNCIIICSIENVDPMGIHTGDSITVSPAQTLTDKEYQVMRDAAFSVLREVGVETGGSNVQFAVDPKNGRQVVIEMNPRVSRSSALASKATGFPIARVAAKLAVGYQLDELENEITGGLTPASFEPSLDYIVTKIPRFTFEKFPQANDRLTTQMKAVGEVMAIGRTFQESLQKALRGLEVGVSGFDPLFDWSTKAKFDELNMELKNPGPKRLWCIADAFRGRMSVEDINRMTDIDSWFLVQIEDLIWEEAQLLTMALSDVSDIQLRRFKRKGFSDSRLANLLGVSERTFRERRISNGIRPVFKRVDTCAGEFATPTAYLYSTYEEECEADVTDRRKIMVLGGGPNRIGQGIEFDYCCVHAALALSTDGYETIMVNCNPETVSTDYDISDRLYFEPVTLEDVLAIYECEKPEGVIVQFGGQTPLKLARGLEALGVRIIGTSPEAIDRAEDRGKFQEMVNRLDLKQPANAIVSSITEGLRKAIEIGFPIVVRPSYVLGGRAMEIVSDNAELQHYLEAIKESKGGSPVLLDHFLDSAIEVDIDAVSDGEKVVIGGVMEHIEQAGVHSGDSACSLPTCSLNDKTLQIIKNQVVRMAKELQVIGLMNVQMAVQGDCVYVLEVNPRASRTVPFVSKCIGISLAKVAARCMVGVSLSSQGFETEKVPNFFSVKEAVFPFSKFPGVDPILGPEMKSTGEVMGTGETFDEAFAKAHAATGELLPISGCAFLSVRDADKPRLESVARNLIRLGFSLVATNGTCKYLEAFGIPCIRVNKVSEGRPNIVDMLKDKIVDFVINTTEGRQAIRDSAEIRRTTLRNRVCYATTITGADAIVRAASISGSTSVRRLQDLHRCLH